MCACALVLTSDATAATSGDFSGHERQVFPVVVVHGLTLGDLPQLATEGAVGLMVPNAGPRTSQVAAFAGRPGDLAVPGLGAEALIAVSGSAHQVEPPITPAAPQRHLHLVGKATALGRYRMPRCPAGGS